jgi:Ca-activated chloride channel family protein
MRVGIFVLMLSLLALVFVIGLRPMKEDYNSEVRLGNLDVLFVVDTTISMWAEDDPKGVRMDSVRSDIRYITDELSGANFALITFDDKSTIRLPFTQDRETLFSVLNSLEALSPYSTTGTDMNTPYLDIESLLISSSKKQNHRAVVFFMSDGEVTKNSDLRSYSELSDLLFGGAVLGYGTEAGGQMKVDYEYLYDYDTHDRALSKIDEETLNAIASDLNIPYVRMAYSTEIVPILTRIEATGDTLTEKRPGVVTYKDTYQYFVIPLLLALAGAIALLVRAEKSRCTTK